VKPARILLFTLLIMVVLAAGWFLQRPGHDGVWQFNFAPGAGPAVPAFTNVGAETDYSRWRGYGWLDAGGPVQHGRWPGDREDSWESRSNLNVLQRRGPDDLARSFARGPASFVIDLDPGTYEVWVLSGDAGHLESVAYQPYRIQVEDKTVYDYAPQLENLLAQRETPPAADQLDHQAIWEQSIAPRFRWSRAVVEVSDGQLTVTVDGEVHDDVLQPFLGEYAHTEQRSGPRPAFSGALNALLVLPYAAGAATGERLVAQIDAWRQQNIRDKWPLVAPGRARTADMTAADRGRGYTVSPVDVLQPVMPADQYPHTVAVMQVRATPGEYVPITFAVTPLKDLGDTRVSLGELQPLDVTGEAVSVGRDLRYGVVRYRPVAISKGKRRWQARPAMIVPQDRVTIEQGVARQFWLTWHVPPGLAAGSYRASLMIEPALADATRLDVDIEVLPFTLQRPTGLAVGMTYFSPAAYALRGEEAFWQRVAAEFADMRAHNMTSVQYTGIRMDDYDRMGRALALYRDAGFEQPINLLESHGAMLRWPRRGIPWSSPQFQSEYVQLVQSFLQQARRRNWPPVIIDFGDEFTNSASEETGAEIARRLKTIPGIVTAADVDGYKEMTLLAPQVDIVAFTNGWDGPDKVNRGKRLLHGGSVDFIIKAGALPWLVNVGMDRFSNGFWFWKMVQRGVRGKMEWIYRGYSGLPYDVFDAEPLRAAAVYPGPNGMAIPSLAYEWMRIGLDDLAYLNTLSRTLERNRSNTALAATVAATDAWFSQLDELIHDDMNYYREPATRAVRQWPAARYRRLRDEIIDLLLRFERG